ncbi:MAG: hypothetical protein QOG18_1110 [Microbacteriaceae bacterium]|nr:hypothetical protein [Microbacteriaceae bacterium]
MRQDEEAPATRLTHLQGTVDVLRIAVKHAFARLVPRPIGTVRSKNRVRRVEYRRDRENRSPELYIH